MTTNDDQNTGQLPSKISRRTLAAGAAWSVPVIAVASAAPAYAVSGADCIEITLGNRACKVPGQSGQNATPWYYFLDVCFTNTCTAGGDVHVVVTGANTVSGVTIPGFAFDVMLGPGESHCETAEFCSTNSAGAIRIVGTIAEVPIPNQGAQDPGRIPAGPNDFSECQNAGSCPT